VAPSKSPLTVLLKPGDRTAPLFLAAGRGGAVIKLKPLSELLPDGQAVFGLHPHGFDPEDFPATHEEIIAAYVAAVREIQPHGPYYLGGYSSGGVTAFHMARHLELAGERVALVAAIDSVVNSPRVPRWKRRVNRFRRLLHDPGRLLGRYRKRVPEPGQKARMEYRQRGEPLPEWLRVSRENVHKAPRSGRLGTYSGPVTLFRARWGARFSRALSDLGWSAAAPGGVRIIDVAGDHSSMLVRHVRSLAAELSRVLREARDAAASERRQP
jgi:thioesterase domain-containing protein